VAKYRGSQSGNQVISYTPPSSANSPIKTRECGSVGLGRQTSLDAFALWRSRALWGRVFYFCHRIPRAALSESLALGYYLPPLTGLSVRASCLGWHAKGISCGWPVLRRPGEGGCISRSRRESLGRARTCVGEAFPAPSRSRLCWLKIRFVWSVYFVVKNALAALFSVFNYAAQKIYPAPLQ
jgi:hypothetical protein